MSKSKSKPRERYWISVAYELPGDRQTVQVLAQYEDSRALHEATAIMRYEYQGEYDYDVVWYDKDTGTVLNTKGTKVRYWCIDFPYDDE